MRKGLIVGINYYENENPLHGCVCDASSVNKMLMRNADTSLNFYTKIMLAPNKNQAISRIDLRQAIEELFQDDSEIALLYFAGHGYMDATGGFLCPSDASTGDDGIAMADVMAWANQSAARFKVIILDSCHSGVTGNNPLRPVAELSEGITVITASTAEQYASEQNGSGVFTSLFVDALGGAAANLVGDVTPGSVYAHIDQSLGPWAQRPVFKTNVKSFVSLRKAQPPLELSDLRKLKEFFPEPKYNFRLDPSYEPERNGHEPSGTPKPNPNNVAIFTILQKLNRVNLIVPVQAPHMWHAAMESKSCTLTALGEHYRRLVHNGMI